MPTRSLAGAPRPPAGESMVAGKGRIRSLDRAEYNELLMCVAAPVLGPGGRGLGSVGISMVRHLVQRVPGRLKRLVPLVRACGARVSAELAGPGNRRSEGKGGAR